MTAIVLAGGRGRRMNADKAGLAVAGKTLLGQVLAQLEPYFDEVLVSVSPGQAGRVGALIGRTFSATSASRALPSLDIGVVEDEVPGLGPLGGIVAGLKAAKNDSAAVVACDIPDVDIRLLRSLARAAGTAEIAVPAGPAGHFEPLLAVYQRSIVPEVEALLGSGERSVIPLFGRCRTAVVRVKNLTWLRNLNTRADYESYLRSLADRRACAEGKNRSGLQDGERSKAARREKRRRVQRPGRVRRP